MLNGKLRFRYKTRDDTKVPFMKQVLFPRKREGKPLWVAFEDEFPILAEAILRFKLNSPRGWSGSSSRFAIHLQKLEARAVIETAIPRLHEKGIIVIPVHDSLVCKRSECETVRDVLIQSVEEVTGFAPTVGIKTSNDEQKEAA